MSVGWIIAGIGLTLIIMAIFGKLHDHERRERNHR